MDRKRTKEISLEIVVWGTYICDKDIKRA